MNKGILGSLYHTPVKGEFEYIEQALIVVNSDGKIAQILTPNDHDYTPLRHTLRKQNRLETLSEGQYLLPGMIDLHIHAPQWPQAGKGLDLPLDQWLLNYTFPLESKYTDPEFAQSIYPHLVDTYLAHGTTTGVYFATVDVPSSLYLARVCLQKGQRAYVGKVAMDDKTMCPDYYVDQDHQTSVTLTESFIQAVQALPENSGLIQPVVTPRFVPTCTLDALHGLGQLAKTYDCVVQTHAAESDWARDYSQEKYGKTDIELYHDAGLLGRKTILAHAIFLTDKDVEIVKRQQSGLAHCPLSNTFFANAALPARERLDANLHLGLGSDVAASPYPSLFRTCFDAVTHSRARENGTDHRLNSDSRGINHARITLLEAYWMATVGGAQVLDLPAGQFKPGYHFDAICVSATDEHQGLKIYPRLDSPQDIFEKLIAYTDNRNICKVWVGGKLVRTTP